MQDPPAHGGGLRGHWVLTWQYLIYHFVLWDLQCTLIISQASGIKEVWNKTSRVIYPLHTLGLKDSDSRGRFVGKW